MIDLPTGTVTPLFTDIEGSTRLLQRLGNRYVQVLAVHRELLRAAFGQHHGHEAGTEGDRFFVAFAKASDAVAAEAGQQHAVHQGQEVDALLGGQLHGRALVAPEASSGPSNRAR
jgi:class 3 adenylate cyclase